MRFLFLVATLQLVSPAEITLHYDDFCIDEVDRKSVVFTKFVGSQCVCFAEGTYEYHEKSSSPACTLNPSQFHVAEQSCVSVPSDVAALTRLNQSPNGALPSVTEYFDECGHFRRVKRDAGNATSGNGTDAMDEDFSSSGTEIGQELMRNQMNQYIESVIAKLTGLQGEGGAGAGSGGGRHKYPVIKLMEYTKQIMQRTCTVVNPDFFDLALNSFINLQLETYHIKEPYIGYSAFKRIEGAMTRCLQFASPHMFVTEAKNVTGGPEMCDNHLPTKSSNQTVIKSGTEDEEVKNITIPPYASSELEPGKIAEPLIESVWKMLVSAHSYCYMYFSDYFNDHHTYTVALLPLFTNEIQEVWLNEANGTKGYDLSDPAKTKLYGGLLGDVISVMKDVDYCVGASRAVSPYPWFMNRPLRDNSNGWNKRKKRSVTGRLVAESRVVVHTCKDAVHVSDACRG